MPTTRGVSMSEVTCILVPHREQHLKQVEQLNQQHQTKVLGAPYFPYDGCALLIETEGDQKTVESFVQTDPYMKAKLISGYAIKEFAGETVEMKRRFERLATDFTFRS